MSYWGRIFPNVSSTPVRYHGLFNQGATCYLNSVLQVLFMSKDFRAAVKSHTSENPDTEYIDRHLTTLFDQLSDNPAHTCQITEKLNITTVHEQCDAAEYFENILRLTSPEASQIFHGLLTHKTTCSVCLKETDTDGPFWHLPLALVDSYSGHYSVINGIEEYFRASDLSGENQIYCGRCDAKTDGNIKCVMKHHPEVLMLLLKRFEIDYRYMAYVKINSSVEVPCTLQMPENQTYELYAVVEHFGDLRSGHYTAMIKDDEKWYNFNDDMVTLPNSQPFKVDTLERSRSAYLLFYRKNVHVTDTCIQDTKESTPGIIPPAAVDSCDQYQDSVKKQEREEIEEAAEVSNGTAGTVSINRNEETRSKDRVGSGEEGLPVYNIEKQDNGVYDRQSIPSNHQGSKDANIRKQRGEGKTTINDDEAMETNAETDDQKEKRESSSIETQLEESFEDRDSHNARLVDVRQRRAGVGLHGDDKHKMLLNYQEDKQDLSNIHARQEYSPQVHVDMHRDEEMVEIDVDEDMDGQMEGDKLSEKREEASTMHLDSDVQYEGIERGGTQEVKLVSVDKQEHEERLEMNVKIDKEGKTRVDEGGRNMPNMLNMPREEKRDDNQGKEQRGTLERHFGDREDQKDGQNTSEQNICVVHTRHEDVGVEGQTKEEEIKRDEGIKNTADSSLRRAGSAESRRETSNQRVHVIEKTRQGASQPKARHEFDVNRAEGIHGSNKSRILHGKIIEDEIRKTPRGTQRSSETICNIRVETVEETVVETIEGNTQRKPDTKPDANIPLSKDLHSLKLTESPLKRRSKGVTENVQEQNESNSDRKRKIMSDADLEPAEINHTVKKLRKRVKKKRLGCFPFTRKQHRKQKNKKKKTTGCFPGFHRRNADQSSESDDDKTPSLTR